MIQTKLQITKKKRVDLTKLRFGTLRRYQAFFGIKDPRQDVCKIRDTRYLGEYLN